jgi:hypothetical protein
LEDLQKSGFFTVPQPVYDISHSQSAHAVFCRLFGLVEKQACLKIDNARRNL